jgi:hypothetical protein
MKVGQAIGSLRKSWVALRIKRREGYADAVYEIEHIQDALGLELTDFGH